MKLQRLSLLLLSALIVTGCNNSNDDPIPLGPGSLDPTFSGDGKIVVSNFGGEMGRDAALQPDGKLLMVGGAFVGVNDQAVMIVRLDSQGALDTTFNGTGKLIFNPSSAQDQAFAVLVQTDGRIVIVGEMDDGGASILVARFNEDGTPDLSFDMDGQVHFKIDAAGAIAYAVAQQADDKLVVVGAAFNGSDRDFAVVRLNTDGSMDTPFDTDGIATVDFRNTDDLPFSVAIGSDDAITVAGYSIGGAGLHDAAVARFTSTGAADTNFDTVGKKIVVIGTAGSAFRDLVIQPDGLIVAAGGSVSGGVLSYTVARFDAAGVLDATWGTGGIVSYTVGTTNSEAFACALQDDGKVLVGGYGYDGGDSDFVLVRLNALGSVDNGFGISGRTSTSFSAGDETIRALVIQTDDRIIAVGNSTSGFVSARYIP